MVLVVSVCLTRVRALQLEFPPGLYHLDESVVAAAAAAAAATAEGRSLSKCLAIQQLSFVAVRALSLFRFSAGAPPVLCFPSVQKRTRAHTASLGCQAFETVLHTEDGVRSSPELMTQVVVRKAQGALVARHHTLLKPQPHFEMTGYVGLYSGGDMADKDSRSSRRYYKMP